MFTNTEISVKHMLLVSTKGIGVVNLQVSLLQEVYRVWAVSHCLSGVRPWCETGYKIHMSKMSPRICAQCKQNKIYYSQ